MSPLLYFWLLLKASLFSTGGSGNIPILYEDLVSRGWATDRQFAEALAIGQISPGPSGLWVISLGYLTDGLRGALLALVAITLPPLLVLAIKALYSRIGKHPLVEGFVRGLGLAAVGLFPMVAWQLLQETGIDSWSVGIMALSLGLGLVQRVPVLAILGLAALIGVLRCC